MLQRIIVDLHDPVKSQIVSTSATNLDSFLGAYQDDFAYALDNRLMLSWYPQRVMLQAHGQSLLELGVGHGYTTKLFSERFPHHVVIEGSPEVIAQFRGNFPDCRAQIDLEYFERFSSDEKFDNIVMGFILEHVDDPKEILIRFRQFLAPGGSIFVAVPNAEALNKRIGQAAGLLDDLLVLSEADLALGHQRLFTLQSLRQLVTECGYREHAVEGLFLKPITTGQIKELKLSEEVLQAMLKVGIDYPELSVGLLMELKEAAC